MDEKLVEKIILSFLSKCSIEFYPSVPTITYLRSDLDRAIAEIVKLLEAEK